jgi:hypothetical protein
MPLLMIVLSACSSAYVVSYYLSKTHAIADGGASNRFWLFLSQTLLLMVAFSPLSLLMPTASSGIALNFYGCVALLGVFNYVASLCHMNQVITNGALNGKLKTLPFDLHLQPRFSQGIFFLSRHITSIMGIFYFMSLAACALSGMYLFTAAAVAMILLDQSFRQGRFPRIFDPFYALMTNILFFNALLRSTAAIIFSLANIHILIWDYAQRHIYKVRPAPTQFPLTSAAYEQIETPQTTHALKSRLNEMKDRKTRVTFDHFEEAYTVSNKLLAKAPSVNFREYLTLFKPLYISSPSFRENLINEMADHEKYAEKSHEEHRLDLKLPLSTAIPDIQAAWLTREMTYLVSRLVTPSHRDLTPEAMATMLGQAAYVLSFIKNTRNSSQKENILLSLAVRTGSHCNGAYMDTFSELSHNYGFEQADLTLRERVILMAQSLREEQFRNYYYKVIPHLQKKHTGLKWTFQDIHDYHSYEIFVSFAGSSYYLRNPALQQTTRNVFKIIGEYGLQYLLSNQELMRGLSRPFFSDYYNSEQLVHDILQGKLHKLFQTWCETTCPGSYERFVWDAENLSVRKQSPDAMRLAELMLLDLGLVELRELPPYEKEMARQEYDFSKQYGLLDASRESSPDLTVTPIDTKDEAHAAANLTTVTHSSMFRPIDSDDKADRESLILGQNRF